jgi:hypothetical protein
MSYVERQIIVTITLQSRAGVPGQPASTNPTFAGTDSNTVKIQGGGAASQNGVRISAKITRPGGVALGQADVRIYNLPLALINQLGTLGYPYVFMVGLNTITIEAGNVGKTPQVLFNGVIFSAYADFSGMPECVFNIAAAAEGLNAAKPATAVGYNGSTTIVDLMQNLATQAELKFVNNGVSGSLSNPYLSGSLRDQLRMIARHTGVAWKVDDVTGTLVIAPKNGNFNIPVTQIPLIAPPPKGTLVGYPAYTAQGLKLRTEFTADVGYGTQVQVESSLEQANGTWTIYYMDYDLECQAPNGPWFTNLEVAAPGFPILPPASS